MPVPDPAVRNRQGDGVVRTVGGADFFKRDEAGGKLRRAVGEHVPPLENGDLLIIFPAQAVALLVDFADLADAEVFLHMGQRAVVGGKDIISVRGPRGAGPAARSHPGVDDGDENRPFRPERNRLKQPVRSAPNVELRYLVRGVENLERPVDRFHHPVHRADRAFLTGKIRLKHQNRFHGSSSLFFIISQPGCFSSAAFSRARTVNAGLYLGKILIIWLKAGKRLLIMEPLTDKQCKRQGGHS